MKMCMLLGRKAMTSLDRTLKIRDITLPSNVCLVKTMVFSVVMYGCESWTIKKVEHLRIDAFELWCWGRLMRVLWTARRSSQSILKKNQSWIFIISTDAETKAPILWPPDGNSQLIRKDPDTRENRRQEEKEMTEDETLGCHNWLNGHEFEQVPGNDEGQGSLLCCSPWDGKELEMTEWLNNIKTSRSQYPQFYPVTSITYRILFFLSQCPHFNISHPTMPGVPLHCYSARMKFWISFSAVSAPGLQEIHVPCSPNTEAFSRWAGNLSPWAPPPLLSFCPAIVVTTRQPHYIHCVSKNIAKYIQASSSSEDA